MFKSNITKSNVYIATKQLLLLMDINIKNSLLTELLLECKNFPSLASISNILHRLRIKNMAVSINEENLEEIPLPAIAYLTIEDGLFVTISKVENNNIEWFHYIKGWQSDFISDFAQKWSGNALLVDSDTITFAQKEFGNTNSLFNRNFSRILVPIVLLVTFFYLEFLNFLFYLPFYKLLFLFSHGVGIVMCIWWASWNHIKVNIQNIRTETSLNMILEKRIFFYIEELGIYYFVCGLCTSIISQDIIFSESSWVMFCLTLVFFSLILFDSNFPAINIKLKLSLLVIVFANAILYYTQLYDIRLNGLLDSTLLVLFCFSIAHLVKNVFIQYKIITKNVHKYESILKDIKNNKSYLFDYLNINNRFPPIFKGMRVIEIGEENALNIITLLGDPSDSIFIKAYDDVLYLINRNETIKAQIIIVGLNHNKKHVNKFIKILLSLPIEEQKTALEKFLQLKGKNIEKWVDSNYKNTIITQDATKVFDLYRSWLDISEKKSIPIILLNDKELPALYQINDIEFIIENQIDSQTKKHLHDIVIEKEINDSINNIVKVDINEIPDNQKEIRLFAIMRNESLRLPYFIEYYKKLGVDRFFLIDNNSTDNSKEIALNQENLHLFSTNETYQNHWYWMEYLLETHGKNYWCVVVDIDELFSFPCSEYLTLNDLIEFLNKEQSTSVCTLLLDMYSNSNIISTPYKVGDNPLIYTPYFDKEYYTLPFTFLDRQKLQYFTSVIFTGGMRERVFGKITPPHILSKVPFFFNSEDTYLVQGMHAVNGSTMSSLQGVVFHTKFLADFIQEVKEETVRGEHYGGAFYYKHYESKIDSDEEISFFDEYSIKYKDSKQLIDLGIMKTNRLFDEFVSENKLEIVHHTY